MDAVLTSFSPRNQGRITRDDVTRVVAELTLDEKRRARQSPSLRIKQLCFAGVKRRSGQPPEPFRYDQAFSPGVNVICIPDNEVGKSSILKTIKYALTGDDGDYDADVHNWITDIWLAFSLDLRIFTVLLSTRGGAPRALLLAGEEFRPLEAVAEEMALTIFDVTGAEAIKAELQRFFFLRLDLGPLSWTQQDGSTPTGIAERSTSWLTYFQALYIPDGGDHYLICDPVHAMGNQDGLILSAFLGLHLVEPLNKLGVEASRVKKEAKVQEQQTAAQVQQAKEQVARLEESLRAAQARLQVIGSTQATRRSAIEGGEPAQRLMAVQFALAEKGNEQLRLEVERNELTNSLQRQRAHERQLREAVSLRLHFTGLEVSLCPNCDATVDTEAVERELTIHLCRLCGHPAHAADHAEMATLSAEAADIRREMVEMTEGRDTITDRLAALRHEVADLVNEANALRQAAQQGITYAFPTAEEASEQSDLLQEVGRIKAEVSIALRRAEPAPDGAEDEIDLRVRVVAKVREVLGKEAGRRNSGLLGRLGALAQATTWTIGAESISDVACSPLGRIDLHKHGQRVTFGGIQNEGERLRIKLAFYLAMTCLGREPGLGRHPGFLLIDQPCSSEMVREDAEALAEIFLRVDTDLADQIQIICGTARSEFEAATADEKVYGAQNPPFAF